jgi:hypothetical protein
MKALKYTAVLAVAAIVTFSHLKTLHAELVFEDDLNSPTSARPVQVQAAPAPAAAQVDERQDLSKAETMRRQRMRQELKNEDALTSKLEELRLKDEMKRSDQILGSGVEKSPEVAPLTEQRIGTAATAAPATLAPAAAPVATNINGAPLAGETVAEMPIKTDVEEKHPSNISFTPRGGLSNMSGSYYDVQATYSFGLDLGVSVTDYFSVVGGYTYSKYSIGAGPAMVYPMGFNTASYLQRLNMNDNVIQLGARAYLLSPSYSFRPFVGAGGAYRRGYVNFDSNTLNFMRTYNPNAAGDVEVTGFSGYLETGMEFKITKSISITGMFRYFNIFSTKQSNPLDPNVFLNQNGYSYASAGYSPYSAYSTGYYGYNSDSRSQASTALGNNNFYQLMAGLTFTF